MAAISAAERQRRDQRYEQGLKECSCCRRAKPLEDFHPRRDGYRGLRGECAKCQNVATSARERRSPDKQAARQKRWRDANPDLARAIAKRYRDSHPEQERARRLRHLVSV
jgi:hypothetical protein